MKSASYFTGIEQEDYLANAIFSGYLKKKSNKNRHIWARRYFVLRIDVKSRPELSYFHSINDAKLNKNPTSIQLSDVGLEWAASGKGAEDGVRLNLELGSKYGREELSLIAPSEEECAAWFHALEKAGIGKGVRKLENPVLEKLNRSIDKEPAVADMCGCGSSFHSPLEQICSQCGAKRGAPHMEDKWEIKRGHAQHTPPSTSHLDDGTEMGLFEVGQSVVYSEAGGDVPAVIEAELGNELYSIEVEGETQIVHQDVLKPRRSRHLPKKLDRLHVPQLSVLPRDVIASELLKSEIAYTEQLRFLYTQCHPSIERSKLITPAELNDLFVNLPQIMETAELILSKIERKLASWNSATTTLGDVFLDLGSRLQAYAFYVSKQSTVTQLLVQLRKNKKWVHFMQDLFVDVIDGNLDTYLQLPTQRLMLYMQYLGQLFQRTTFAHPDHSLLQHATRMLEVLITEMNEDFNQQEMILLESKFMERAYLAKPSRSLVWQGKLRVRRNHATGKFMVFLFNDLMAWATRMPAARSIYEFKEIQCKVPLDSMCKVQGYKEDKMWLTRASLTFKFIFKSRSDRNEFFTAVNSVLSNKTEANEAPLSYMDPQSDSFYLQTITELKKNARGMKPHTFENGDRFIGSMKYGDMEGLGTYFWASGDVYEGAFCKGLRHGEGMLSRSDGSRFKGQFQRDLKHGRGVMNLPDGERIEGQWENDEQEGHGIISRGHQIWDGVWQKGIELSRVPRNAEQGKGKVEEIRELRSKLKTLEEMRLMVELNNTEPSALETFNLAKQQGICAEGMMFSKPELEQWKTERYKNMKQAFLERLQKLNFNDHDANHENSKTRATEWVSKKYPNGDEYTGQTKDEMFEGRGTLKTKDGSKYVGQFQKGLKHGAGILIWPNGKKYEGQFRENMQHGKGVLYMSSGERIEGTWERDMQQGSGLIYDADENVTEGEWIDSVCTTKKKSESKMSPTKSRRSREVDWHKIVESPSIEVVLERPDALHYFAKFVTSECSQENIEFWHAVCKFLASQGHCADGSAKDPLLRELQAIKEQAQRIISEFVGASAARQVNLPSACADACEAAIKEADVAKCVASVYAALTTAKAEVLKLLKQDSFRRYLNSEFWEEFVQAALRNDGTPELIPGVLLLPNGDQYVGEMQDGLYEGRGVYRYHDGGKYDGYFVRGFKQGWGTYYFGEASKYEGEFWEDRKHGKGTMHLENGDKIEGLWVLSVQHGLGTAFLADGGTYDGMWVKGECVMRVNRLTKRVFATYSCPRRSKPDQKKTKDAKGVFSLSGMQLEWEKGVLKRLGRVDLLWANLGKVDIELQPPRCILSFREGGSEALPIAVTITQQHGMSPWELTDHLLEVVQLAANGSVLSNELVIVRCHLQSARCFGLLKSLGVQRQARGERAKLQSDIKLKHKAMLEAAECEDFLLAHAMKEQRNILKEKEQSSRSRDHRKKLARPEEDPLQQLEGETKALTQTMDRLEVLHAYEAADKIKVMIEKLKEFARVQEVTLFAKAPLPPGPPPSHLKPAPPPPTRTTLESRSVSENSSPMVRAMVAESQARTKVATLHPAPVVERLGLEGLNV